MLKRENLLRLYEGIKELSDRKPKSSVKARRDFKEKKKKAINTVSNALGSQREKIKEGTLVLDGI